MLERVLFVAPHGLFLDRVGSSFFETDQAHSLIAVCISRVDRNCSFQFTLPNLSFRHVDDALVTIDGLNNVEHEPPVNPFY